MYIGRLHAAQDKLTQTEQQIAQYLATHSTALGDVTSYDIAEALGVGQSTIIRFAKKLGYQGFRQLQLDLITGGDSAPVEEISVEESTEMTNAKIMRQYQDIVSLTHALNHEDTIDKAVSLIRRSKQVIVYGVGNSYLFAEYMGNQLRKMGISAYSTVNTHIMYSTVSHASQQDLLILISESGETREILKAAQLAHDAKVPVIAITRMVKNTLYEFADIVLRTVNNLTRTRLEAMTIRCSQLYVIDMLYLNLYKTDYTRYNQIIQQAELLLDRSF